MKGWKFLIGVLLLPLVVAETLTLGELATAWVPLGGWKALWFVSFFGGLVAWLMIYLCLPRPMWIYVLGHELTHAWAVYLSGGRVQDFHVTGGGGYVKTDTVNWWIALSPYFVPLYSLIWLGLWWSIHFYRPLEHFQPVLYAGLGLTYGFHLCFTISMIKTGQSDLTSQGTFFSLVVILGANLIFGLIFFVLMAEPITWRFFGETFWAKIQFCYGAVYQGAVWLVSFGVQLLHKTQQ
jgi:hypothetical protein